MVCDLWSVSVRVFQGLLLVIVIMIDGSKKRNCEDGFWTLEFACLWKAQWKRFCVDRASIILTDLILYTKQSESGLWKKKMPFILSRVRVWRLRRRPHFPNFPQLCGAVIHDMNTWLPLSLTWQDYCTFNLQLVTIKGVDWDNSPYVFGQSEKRNWVQCIITTVSDKNSWDT